MTAYPKHVSTGIPWAPIMPSHWEVAKLARVTRIRTGDMDTENATDEGEFPLYVRSPIVRRADRFSFDLENTAVLMSGDGAGAGRIFHRVRGKFGCHQRVYCIEFPDRVDPNFGYYVLSTFFPAQVDAGSAKSTVDSIRKPMLNGFPLAFPSISVQRELAAHLDSATAEIDDIKAQLREQRSLLDKYKRQVIAETVTRGLDPNVPMKDSRERWIGAIPRSWQVVPLRALLRRTSKKGRPDLRLLSVERERGVVDRLTDGSADNHNRVPDDLRDYKVVRNGQFVMNKMKAWQGSYGVSAADGIVSPAYYVFDLAVPVPSFFNWAIRSAAYIGYFGRDSYGIRTDQWDFKPNALKSIPFAMPPENEQREIVSFLEMRVSAINELVADIDRQIGLLETYRKQLISDVVTGKVRVSEDAA